MVTSASADYQSPNITAGGSRVRAGGAGKRIKRVYLKKLYHINLETFSVNYLQKNLSGIELQAFYQQ
uniref:Uncharacterized protein n=1 Tax=Timema poppense TaxID=170557 RepID=A0A7R9GT47_TIMPO|nr:unnamed protein product [Timema poppensis]